MIAIPYWIINCQTGLKCYQSEEKNRSESVDFSLVIQRSQCLTWRFWWIDWLFCDKVEIRSCIFEILSQFEGQFLHSRLITSSTLRSCGLATIWPALCAHWSHWWSHQSCRSRPESSPKAWSRKCRVSCLFWWWQRSIFSCTRWEVTRSCCYVYMIVNKMYNNNTVDIDWEVYEIYCC